MGTSTNGQICYGLVFEEGHEFPWDINDEGIDDWWTFKICGYEHSKECYGEAGRLPGITEADIDVYFKERREFDMQNPLPIKLLNYYYGDCPMYILAVPSSVISNRRGYMKEFDPAGLTVTAEEEAALLEFCKKHEIQLPSLPKWFLTSYCG